MQNNAMINVYYLGEKDSTAHELDLRCINEV